MTPKKELKDKILFQLRYGRENAKKGMDLAEAVGEKDDRIIRRTIRELIAERYLILSSAWGYYFADDAEDLEGHLESLRNRALEDLRRYRDLKIAGKKLLDPHQLDLI